MRTDFTTGQAAKICRVSARTISNWADRGHIPGVWRMPSSGDRRIPREALVGFLRTIGHARGLSELEAGGAVRVLVLSAEPAIAAAVTGLAAFGVEAVVTRCGYEAVAQLAGHRPDLIVIEFAAAGRGGSIALAAIAAGRAGDPVTAFAIADEDETDADGLKARFDRVWKKPVAPAAVADAVREFAEAKLRGCYGYKEFKPDRKKGIA